MIQPAWRGDLHAYLGGIIRTADGIAESIGGVSDHVHLLIGLRATHRLADVIRELKAVSSGWVHNEIGMRSFAWQEGYGAFSVSPSQVPAVIEIHSKPGTTSPQTGFRAGVYRSPAKLWNRIRRALCVRVIRSGAVPTGLDSIPSQQTPR